MGEEISNKKYLDDELDHTTISTFVQTLQNYLKFCNGNNAYNLANYESQRITDTTIFNVGTFDGDLLHLWKILCNDKNNAGRDTKFIKATKMNIPTGKTGGSSIPLIYDSFICIETSSNNFAPALFGNFLKDTCFSL